MEGNKMDNKVNDPVCGMMVDSEKAASSIEYDGKVYYFCAQGCRAQFEKEPMKYIKMSHEQKKNDKC